MEPEFKEGSSKMFSSFIQNLESYVRKHKEFRTVYFHNFSRFDGLFVMKYYTGLGEPYRIRALMRNHILYELGVFAGTSLLVRYRDSMTLLTSSVDSLARTLCPELGGKGALPHTEMRVSNLQERGEEIITYLRQDILLLGGVMQKAQAINWENYEIDVEDVMTISALSLKIFRKQYLPESFEIKIPTRNEDYFILFGAVITGDT